MSANNSTPELGTACTPVAKVTVGFVAADIWEYAIDDEVHYTVTIERSYQVNPGRHREIDT